MSSIDRFEGHWNFTREIRHAHGGVDLVDGSAGFSRQGRDLRYNEVGTLRIGPQEFQAERSYIWREESGVVKVYFDDNRFFHAFTLGKPQAEHFCVPDTYRVKYEIEEDYWTSTWNVTGPRKDYVMITHYTR